MLAVSVDTSEQSRAVVERNALPFPILADTRHEVVRACGLLHPGAGPGRTDIAIPANFLLDRDGRIVFRHVSRSVQDRLDPVEIRAAIHALLPAGGTAGK